MTRLQLAKLIWKIGYDAAKKADPKAPMRDWEDHQKHIIAGFLAIADWHKKEVAIEEVAIALNYGLRRVKK